MLEGEIAEPRNGAEQKLIPKGMPPLMFINGNLSPVSLARSIIASFLLFALPALADTNAIRGKCVGVHDGDTITILNASNVQFKVRLSGIDAPELGQDFGQRAKQALSGLVFGKDVRIESTGQDRYGRTIGTVFVGTNTVNLEMIHSGMAWVYREYSKDKALLDAERTARERKLGLWVDEAPVPPWQFRKEEHPK